MYGVSSPRLGAGWTSESTQRTAMRSAAGIRSCEWVNVIWISSVLLCLLRRPDLLLLCAHPGGDVYAVELRRVAPAQLLALFGGQRFRQLVDVAALPVRVARAEHRHVVLAGEAEPLAGELDVTGTVEAALDEIHVTGQVVAGNPRSPRRLLQVWPAEGVHSPHKRSNEVRGTVTPDELQAGKALENALGDQVHLVVQVIQRHEADVLLVGAGIPVRGRRIGNARADIDVRGNRKARVGGRLPQRPELGLAVDLAGLQWDTDLDYARMPAPSLDFAQCPGDVVGIDADGAAEPVAELAGL